MRRRRAKAAIFYGVAGVLGISGFLLVSKFGNALLLIGVCMFVTAIGILLISIMEA